MFFSTRLLKVKGQLLPQFLSNQLETLRNCCRHIEDVNLFFLTRKNEKKSVITKLRAFQIQKFFRLWLIQDFFADWAIGRVRGRMMEWAGLADNISTGASSVSHRHNFLVFFFFFLILQT